MPRGSFRKLYKSVLRKIGDATPTINKSAPLVWSRTLALISDHEVSVPKAECKPAHVTAEKGKQVMEEGADLPLKKRSRRSRRGLRSKEKAKGKRLRARRRVRTARRNVRRWSPVEDEEEHFQVPKKERERKGKKKVKEVLQVPPSGPSGSHAGPIPVNLAAEQRAEEIQVPVLVSCRRCGWMTDGLGGRCKECGLPIRRR